MIPLSKKRLMGHLKNMSNASMYKPPKLQLMYLVYWVSCGLQCIFNSCP